MRRAVMLLCLLLMPVMGKLAVGSDAADDGGRVAAGERCSLEASWCERGVTPAINQASLEGPMETT